MINFLKKYYMGLIPKIIHQIWFQGEDQIPDKYLTNRKLWLDTHSDWQYILWDQSAIEKLIQQQYSHLWNTYQSFTFMHQKIDFFKYIILYHQGGIYVDIDAKPIQKLDKLFDDLFPRSTFLVSKCKYDWLESKVLTGYSTIINNGIIAAAPKHRFLLQILNYVNNLEIDKMKMPKELLINKTTGPIMVTQMYFQAESEIQNQVTVLKHQYFEPCYPFEFRCQYTEKTFIDHQHELTWVGNPLKVLLKIYLFLKRYKWIVLTTLILFIFARFQ